ncbi:MAG: SUMF1/EgtB/PvdO family nonheme iron enzyme [Deltaproteobacteria bacterium]|nr:SUMF1/EgtB/PvdO family nonheme iron enzyme [Deltaproteobacteria bacterium]
MTFGVLPLQPGSPHARAAASAFSSRLELLLRQRKMSVVPARKLTGEMTRLGIAANQRPTLDQLVSVGRAVGADRVLHGDLRLEPMVYAKGDVWEIEVEQIDVTSGKLRGNFKRVTAFGSAHGAEIMPSFVDRILAYDPAAAPLAMSNPTPLRAPDDAPKETGMAYVPAGEFIMGSDRGEVDEEPRHAVYTDAYFIDIHETTNAEYDRCVAAKKCKRSTARSRKKMDAPNQPVAGVGFQDAANYCAFAGKRLLTEAEWEKAARGTDERAFPWGNDWRDDRANMAWAKDGFTHTAPVGSFAGSVSPYGAHNMAGNMWEWTADLYDAEYYRKAPRRNPKGPNGPATAGSRRVMRGGSWMYNLPFFLTTHNRSPGRPHIRKMWVAFAAAKMRRAHQRVKTCAVGADVRLLN